MKNKLTPHEIWMKLHTKSWWKQIEWEKVGLWFIVITIVIPILILGGVSLWIAMYQLFTQGITLK